MKLMRNDAWELLGWTDKMSQIFDGPVFLFRDRQHDEVLALKVAKLVMVEEDLVLFFDALKRRISRSNSEANEFYEYINQEVI